MTSQRSSLIRLSLVALFALLVSLAALDVRPASAGATFTVTKTADTADGVCDADCSLREAIIAANALAGADTITLPAGTYILTIAGANEDAAASGDLDITDGLTITGAGAATTIIDGGALDRVFHIPLGGTTVDISGLTIRNGSVAGWFPFGAGGGIFNQGTLTLTNSTVSGNTAFNGGGGIANGYTATLTLTNSTVSGNSATGGSGAGGGIANVFGTATLNNSTVSGNTASGTGGGILNVGGPATLNNSTVSGNSADFTGGGGGIFNVSPFDGTTTLKNTIVSNSPFGGNCGGAITSAGYNLSSDGTCAFAATGDLNTTNPLLGPLANNGGPTQTHALLADSPAIDAGSPDCPPPATDQRGVARPQGPACDIGAYELRHRGLRACEPVSTGYPRADRHSQWYGSTKKCPDELTRPAEPSHKPAERQ